MKKSISKRSTVVVFLLLTMLFTLLNIWLIQHNYLSDYATLHWSQILTTLSSPIIKVEDLGLIYPVIPVYLLSIFYYIPGMNSPLAPYFLSSLFAAATLSLWYFHLLKKGYSTKMSLSLLLLTASHPFFLWSATTGTEKAYSLLMFYLMCLGFVRLTHKQDVRAFILLGWVVGLYFLVDQRAIFLYIGLLPLLILIAPPKMLIESASSVYIIFSLPIIIIICSWAYLNWVFRGNALHFLTDAESGFLGARLLVEKIPWLQQNGGFLLTPTLISFAMSLISFPFLLWVFFNTFRNQLLFRSTAVFFLHPLIALVLATYLFFIDHPISMLFLYGPAVMVVVILIPRLAKKHHLFILLLLMLGNFGGFYCMTYLPTIDMKNWQQSIAGIKIDTPYPAAMRLGQWLAENRYVTLMDNELAYQAIIARQDTQDLLLPNNSTFKVALKLRDLSALRDANKVSIIQQIVVINPRSPKAIKDKITQRYPTLYKQGLEDYHLVYDRDYWRVYRHRDSL